MWADSPLQNSRWAFQFSNYAALLSALISRQHSSSCRHVTQTTGDLLKQKNKWQGLSDCHKYSRVRERINTGSPTPSRLTSDHFLTTCILPLSQFRILAHSSFARFPSECGEKCNGGAHGRLQPLNQCTFWSNLHSHQEVRSAYLRSKRLLAGTDTSTVHWDRGDSSADSDASDTTVNLLRSHIWYDKYILKFSFTLGTKLKYNYLYKRWPTLLFWRLTLKTLN